MSMNVGDSTDLIHGGGGGLGVFWRSRTEFEKKLLVAMVVMVLTIIGLVVAVGILGAQNSKNIKSDKLCTTTSGHIPTSLITEKSNLEEPTKDEMQARLLVSGETRNEHQESQALYGLYQPTVAKTEPSPTASPDKHDVKITKTFESSVRDTVIDYNDFATEESSP